MKWYFFFLLVAIPSRIWSVEFVEPCMLYPRGRHRTGQIKGTSWKWFYFDVHSAWTLKKLNFGNYKRDGKKAFLFHPFSLPLSLFHPVSGSHHTTANFPFFINIHVMYIFFFRTFRVSGKTRHGLQASAANTVVEDVPKRNVINVEKEKGWRK